jgi:hypothetical protein
MLNDSNLKIGHAFEYMLQILDLTNSSYTTLFSSEETHKRTVRNVDRFRVEYGKVRNDIVSVRLSHDSNYVNALGVVFGVFEPYFILGLRWVMVAVQWITTTWTILLLCACLGTFSGADDCSFCICNRVASTLASLTERMILKFFF